MIFSLSLMAQNQAEDVQTFMLDNGMKIMVIEDHSIPTANMYLFFKVGSRNEVPGITGLSHFFEHMMFNGAKKYGFKQFDNVMEAAGGSNNAYTSKNLTVYTDFYPVSAMEKIFDLEADRIQYLAFDSAVIESERGVVYNEYKTGMENSAYRLLNYETNAAAFTAHPYHWSVIGYESDILSWEKEDLENYFDTYYTPNNCLVVFSGAVNTDEVKALSKQYFEPIPNKGTPPVVRTVEPKQNGERRVKVYKNLSAPHLMMLYHVPQANHEDYYALDILSSILSAGNSARLNKSLVFDKQLANGFYTDMPVSFDPDVFTIYAVAASNETAEALELGIYEEIEKIINNPIEDKELQKIKNQKLMEFYQNMETINGRSNSVGNYELFFGDYKKLYEAPENYNKVTVEDIKRVAKTYLNEDNRTFGIISAKK